MRHEIPVVCIEDDIRIQSVRNVFYNQYLIFPLHLDREVLSQGSPLVRVFIEKSPDVAGASGIRRIDVSEGMLDKHVIVISQLEVEQKGLRYSLPDIPLQDKDGMASILLIFDYFIILRIIIMSPFAIRPVHRWSNPVILYEHGVLEMTCAPPRAESFPHPEGMKKAQRITICLNRPVAGLDKRVVAYRIWETEKEVDAPLKRNLIGTTNHIFEYSFPAIFCVCCAFA